jgi:hypothetical protein
LQRQPHLISIVVHQGDGEFVLFWTDRWFSKTRTVHKPY